MVCLGNICRSPIAEGIMRHKAASLGLGWIIDSAGTEGYHIGETPHPFSQKICGGNGIDISKQRARRFTGEDFDRYDHIYAMAADVLESIRGIAGPKYDAAKVSLFLEDLNPGMNQSVPDPWYGNEDGYAPVYDLIAKGCDAILNKRRQ